MIEIIPNWHPVFVHFTVGLLSIASLLFLAGVFTPAGAAWKQTCLTVARWNLWMGAAITIGTVLAGWQAYNTVAHDAASHAAMTDHRNWALVTASAFIILALWSFAARKRQQVNMVFIVLLVAASSLLAITGFKGGEAVYRYGLGVMSLPQIAEDGGHGSHSHAGDGNGGLMPAGKEAAHDASGEHAH
jgi:uncharacterized membrane protein